MPWIIKAKANILSRPPDTVRVLSRRRRISDCVNSRTSGAHQVPSSRFCAASTARVERYKAEDVDGGIRLAASSAPTATTFATMLMICVRVLMCVPFVGKIAGEAIGPQSVLAPTDIIEPVP